jgi:chemotaxis protein MotA
MNLGYLIGVIAAFVFMILGMAQGSGFTFQFQQLFYYLDVTSVFIVVGCTIAVVVASFPFSMITSMPKHFSIMLNTKRYNPIYYIDQLVDLAQVARKNGLLSLEEKANAQPDPFFRQAIMLIVDANDQDKVRNILNNDIEVTSARHEGVIGMYEKASGVAPAFGMVGTLIGLIKMLKSMNPTAGGSNDIGPAMGVALITTLYGCILAHMVFNPIASNLRVRDEEEVLCRMIILDGIMSIQSGENPKFLKEKLLTFTTQKQRDAAMGTENNSGKTVKKRKSKKK